MRQRLRHLAAFSLCFLASSFSFANMDVAPLVGSWDYGFNRCETTQWGRPSAQAAMVDGGNHYYEYGCGWEFANIGPWGVAPDGYVGGACGGPPQYPNFKFGVESVNARKISYRVWHRPETNCVSVFTDGLTIYRARPVECPTGYVWNTTDKVCRRSGPVDPNRNGDGCGAFNNGSNPIHSALGTKLQVEADLDFAGGLRFERRYSSAAHWKPTVLGRQWRHNFMQSVRLSEFTQPQSPPPQLRTLWAERANGELISFNQIGSGAWSADVDVNLRLSELVDDEGARIGWRIVTSDDSVEEYSIDGLWVGITHRDGSGLTFEYEGARLIRAANERGRELRLEYENGRLARVVAPDGSVGVSFAYDSENRLVSASYPHDVSRTYLYELGNLPRALTGIVDERGIRVRTWGYLADGRAWFSTMGDAESPVGRHSLQFNADQTTTVTDPVGTARTYGFQHSQGVVRVASVSHPCAGCGGNANTRQHDANGNVASEVDHRGTRTDSQFDLSRNLVEERVQALTSDGQPTESTRTIQTDWHPDFRLPVERRTLDAAGALRARELEQYNPRGQLTASCSIDPANPSAMAYTCGQQANAPEGVRQTRFAYCEQADVEAPGSTCPLLGLVKWVDGPRTDVADVTHYHYYPADAAGCAAGSAGCSHRKGDLQRVVNALGHETVYLAYDGAGRATRLRDANGVVSEMEYSPRGWLLVRRVLDPNGGAAVETRFDYNPSGDLTRITQPDGSWLDYHYDAARRLEAISDRLGNRIDYELDNAGNRTAERVRDPGGNLVREARRVYDQLGRLHRQLDSRDIATEFGYDPNGNQTSTIDGLSSETRQAYDPLNRLRSTIQDYLGLAAETAFGYDALDRLVTVTDPNGLVTEYGYDGLGNLRSLSSPDTGLTEYAADAAGNRTWQRDARGVETEYDFDALNRLVEIRYADDSYNVGFEYDIEPEECPKGERFGQGRLGRMSDCSGETVYCYTARGQLARKFQRQGRTTLETAYEYTAADRLARVRYPSGSAARYERDVMGRVSQLRVFDASAITICLPGQPCNNETTLVSAVDYAPFGAATRLQFFEGREAWSVALNLDLDGRVEALHSPEGELGFGYDAVGNIDALQRKGEVRSIGYDALYRLDRVEASGAGVLEAYSYDATGNRLSEFDPDSGLDLPYSYAPASHRLMSRGGDLREMDAAGNSTRIGSRRFDYGPNGRLVAVRDAGDGLVARDASGGSLLAEYVHSGRGERLRKAVAGREASFFIYGEGGELLGEYSESGQPRWEIIWLEGRPVGALHQRQLWAIETDHLGTPRALRDLRGTAHWRWDLLGNAFGAHAAETDPDGNGVGLDFPLRYPGQYFDAETGLHYNYFRDYEAVAGRYVQSDPIGLKDGPSTYSYVRSSPIYLFDQFGLASQYFGFNKDDENRMRAANEEAREMLAKCQGCHDCGVDGNRSEYCIDEYTKYQVLAMLASAEYRYVHTSDPNSYCADHRGSNVINIYPNALGTTCCALSSTLAHEAGHAVGLTHHQIMYYERECFGCDRFAKPYH
jgi:RHS repeat-associated protein